MSHRVLVVDDYEPWRRQLGAALQASPRRWQIVGEAQDGLEAIHKAEALRPDLILLDVGLPLLNGIEVARRILARHPTSRILFVSEHSSPDIVETALGAGARGYILKSDAAAELLPAMETIVEGGQLVSTSLTGHSDARRERRRVARVPADHSVGFYSDSGVLLDDFARFAEAALRAGKALMVLSVDSRRRALQQALEARGIDVDRLASAGRYRWLDVADILSTLLVGDRIDEARFWSVIPPLIVDMAGASTAEPPGVAAWGECAPTLWGTGRVEAAIRLEQLWEEVVRLYGMNTLCAYASQGLSDEGGSIFQKICTAHSSVHTR